MRWAVLLIFAVTVIVALGPASAEPKSEKLQVQLGDLSISKTGVLSINGQSARYLLVPESKYPAELRGIALIDVNTGIYVARFFEPGGVGVEGFFDICFQVKGRDVSTTLIENAGSLERIDGNIYARSCSYVFDSQRGVLLKTAFGDQKPLEISITHRLNPKKQK